MEKSKHIDMEEEYSKTEIASGNSAEEMEKGNEVIDTNTTINCDICLEDGESVKADSFCNDCNDYLCSDCTKYHHKNRLSRGHKLLDSSNMPFKKMPKKKNAFDSLETCKQHGKVLSHVCLNDDELICESCVPTYHRTCDKVFPASDIIDEEMNADTFKCFVTQLCDIKQRFNICQHKCKENADLTQSMHTKALCIVTDILSALKNNDILKIASIDRTCEFALAELSILNEYIESVQAVGINSQLFVAMKIVGKEINRLEHSLETVEKDNEVSVYEFVPLKATEVTTVPSNRNVTLGELVLKSGTVPYYDICVKAPSDRSPCFISDMCVISPSVLFAVDYGNSKIKLVDIKRGILTFDLELTSRPYCVAKINASHMAVTLSGGKVQMMTNRLQDNMVDTHFCFRTEGDCRGIAYIPHTRQLAVSFCNLAMIQFTDLLGNVVRSIKYDTNVKELILFPQYILEMKEKLYIAEHTTNRVVCIDLDGKAVYSHDEIERPISIVKSHGGDLFIAFEGRSIVQMDASLTKRSVVLQAKDGLPDVLSMCYDSESKIMFVGGQSDRLNRYFVQMDC